MCSNFVLIASIESQDSAQMHLAQDNDVVHTFTPDRSDQPFGKAILPRRGLPKDLMCERLGPRMERSSIISQFGCHLDPQLSQPSVGRIVIVRRMPHQ